MALSFFQCASVVITWAATQRWRSCGRVIRHANVIYYLIVLCRTLCITYYLNCFLFVFSALLLTINPCPVYLRHHRCQRLARPPQHNTPSPPPRPRPVRLSSPDAWHARDGVKTGRVARHADDRVSRGTLSPRGPRGKPRRPRRALRLPNQDGCQIKH